MARLGYPLPRTYPVTRAFGDRSISVINHVQIGAHTGLDLGAPAGTPVLAAAAGTVLAAGWLDSLGGRMVDLTHGPLETRYAHLSRIDVQAGQSVGAGQQIGLVGSSGAATGPHLHFEVIDHGGGSCGLIAYGRCYQNPADYIGAPGANPSTAAPAHDYGAIYPLLESEMAAWAESGANPCAAGYQLGTVDPRINYLLDNPAGSGPKGAHWIQAPLVHEHAAWAAKLGDTAAEGSGVRFACVRGDIGPGNVNEQQLVKIALPALLEPALAIAVVAGGIFLVWQGFREVLAG